MTDRLLRLHSEHGQSPWLDNLQRSFVRSGGLSALIENGIRGLTSNPTIFQKAIEGSPEYDTQFAGSIARGAGAVDAYWDLVTTDIQEAADVFAPLHNLSGGMDGFVSVEVDPRLANDCEGTLAAARALHERVGRPNVMVKIPATEPALPAIRDLIADGRNVNVTLIFGLDRYVRVMEAYMQGLETRLERGLPLRGIASVASFFISRVDTEIDRRLETIGTPQALALRGTAAVNQARLAYRDFRRVFSGPRWDRLASAGAAVQRPLWASTSTKNPQYPDTRYVDELIGPDTVNTLPDATMAAFADHGRLARTIDSSVEVAEQEWGTLSVLGVDVHDVASTLEREGVASFIASFEQLLGVLEGKMRGLGGTDAAS